MKAPKPAPLGNIFPSARRGSADAIGIAPEKPSAFDAFLSPTARRNSAPGSPSGGDSIMGVLRRALSGNNLKITPEAANTRICQLERAVDYIRFSRDTAESLIQKILGMPQDDTQAVHDDCPEFAALRGDSASSPTASSAATFSEETIFLLCVVYLKFVELPQDTQSASTSPTIASHTDLQRKTSDQELISPMSPQRKTSSNALIISLTKNRAEIEKFFKDKISSELLAKIQEFMKKFSINRDKAIVQVIGVISDKPDPKFPEANLKKVRDGGLEARLPSEYHNKRRQGLGALFANEFSRPEQGRCTGVVNLWLRKMAEAYGDGVVKETRRRVKNAFAANMQVAQTGTVSRSAKVGDYLANGTVEDEINNFHSVYNLADENWGFKHVHSRFSTFSTLETDILELCALMSGRQLPSRLYIQVFNFDHVVGITLVNKGSGQIKLLFHDPRPGQELWQPLYVPLDRSNRTEVTKFEDEFGRKLEYVQGWQHQDLVLRCYSHGAADQIGCTTDYPDDLIGSDSANMQSNKLKLLELGLQTKDHELVKMMLAGFGRVDSNQLNLWLERRFELKDVEMVKILLKYASDHKIEIQLDKLIYNAVILKNPTIIDVLTEYKN